MSKKALILSPMKKLIPTSSSSPSLVSPKPLLAAHGAHTSSKEEAVSRLLLADEGFGYARSLARNNKWDKITATCVESEADFKTGAANFKYLKSSGATVIGGVDPGKLGEIEELKGKNYNRIHINNPDPNIIEPFFKHAKGILRGFGEIEMVVDLKADRYKELDINTIAKNAGLILKGTKNFEASEFEYYSAPTAVTPPPGELNPQDYGLKVLHYKQAP